MARNGSGTYSLPSGNPVVTGTTISSTTHNNTMSDIATALTGSVAKNGETVMTGDLDLNGNAFILDVDGDSKVEVSTDDRWDLTLGGVLSLSLTSTKADNLDDIAALSHTDNAIIQSDGTDWEAVTVFDAPGAINEKEGSAVASASTTNIWATDGNTVHVTGTTTITSLGTAPQAGAKRTVIFDGALTLTHGANLNLPGGANITTAAGDSMEVYADTTTQLDVVRYTKADGTAVVETDQGGAIVVLDTPQATTSGTTKDFTAPSAGIKGAIINFVGVSPGGAGAVGIQIGDSGGIEATGYLSTTSVIGASSVVSSAYTAFFSATAAGSTSSVIHGSARLCLADSSSNTWTWASSMALSDSTATYHSAGSKSLSAELTTIRLLDNASGAFDAGSINVTWIY